MATSKQKEVAKEDVKKAQADMEIDVTEGACNSSTGGNTYFNSLLMNYVCFLPELAPALLL